MTIGDVLAVIALLLAVSATWAATILVTALSFPDKAAHAQEQLVGAPGRTLLCGLLTTAGVAIVAGIVNSSHSGPTRIVAGILWSVLILISALGGAGIVRMMAVRIEASNSQLVGIHAFTRAAILYVAACYLPVVGWFLIAPAALILSVGAATGALFSPRSQGGTIAGITREQPQSAPASPAMKPSLPITPDPTI